MASGATLKRGGCAAKACGGGGPDERLTENLTKET